MPFIVTCGAETGLSGAIYCFRFSPIPPILLHLGDVFFNGMYPLIDTGVRQYRQSIATRSFPCAKPDDFAALVYNTLSTRCEETHE